MELRDVASALMNLALNEGLQGNEVTHAALVDAENIEDDRAAFGIGLADGSEYFIEVVRP